MTIILNMLVLGLIVGGAIFSRYLATKWKAKVYAKALKDELNDKDSK